MKTSLLTVFFFAGAVQSRSVWEIFDYLFGNEVGFNEQNSIPHDDEDRYSTKSKAERPIYNEEDNEISYQKVNSHDQGGNDVDNRVGPLHPTEHDPSTEEDYKNILDKLIKYLNLSGQDNSVDQGLGFAYTQKRIRHGRYDNYGYYVGEGGDPDYDGNDPDPGYDVDDESDFDFDDDFDDEFGYHDELK